MTPQEQELLIEQVASAYRPSSTDELSYHAAWHDLDEAALDPAGLSTTAHAVLRRLRR